MVKHELITPLLSSAWGKNRIKPKSSPNLENIPSKAIAETKAVAKPTSPGG
ncbi:hypothetical protein ES703_78909 [subsurface metagenome]